MSTAPVAVRGAGGNAVLLGAGQGSVGVATSAGGQPSSDCGRALAVARSGCLADGAAVTKPGADSGVRHRTRKLPSCGSNTGERS